MKKSWVIPEANAEFVYRMEDVLDVYTRPYDPDYPVICMDEASKQLVSEIRKPIPARPGQPLKYDYEYRREGVCNVFMYYEPLGGQRHVMARDRKTKVDWAHCTRDLVDTYYSGATVITLVQDNLSTHGPAAFYEVFPPEEAKRIIDRLEFHYTPKHGSWLNMAEIELSVLSRQCLDRRIPDKQQLQREVLAWEQRRNARQDKVDWRFTASDARIRLKKLYPSIKC